MTQKLNYQILVDKKNVIVGYAVGTGSIGDDSKTHRWIFVTEELYRSAEIETSPVGRYMYNESDGTIYENPDFAEANAAGKIYNWETMEWEYPNWGTGDQE